MLAKYLLAPGRDEARPADGQRPEAAPMQHPDQPPRHRRKTRVTITDVAQLAKVSVASVSRFLNAPESVSQEMGERIATALRSSGFRVRRPPTPVAQPHAQQMPRLVAFLTLGERTAREMLGMPAFPQLFDGVSRMLQAHQGNLLYSHYTGEGPLPAVLTDGSLDGILVFGRLARMPPALVEALLATPSAWVMRQHSDPLCRIDHIFYDNAQIGRLAADYLQIQGGTRLAVINGMPEHEAYHARQEGFLAACHEAGIAASSMTTSPERPTLRAVVEAIMQVRDRPQGIFVPSDEQLLEVYHHLRQLGFAPEESLRLIGCNNDPMLMVRMDPRPATIDIHLGLIGERAVEQLGYRRANRTTPPMQIFVNPTVVRGSH
jgi:DNA-binding LacI/PurR family transcriptional regulator